MGRIIRCGRAAIIYAAIGIVVFVVFVAMLIAFIYLNEPAHPRLGRSDGSSPFNAIGLTRWNAPTECSGKNVANKIFIGEDGGTKYLTCRGDDGLWRVTQANPVIH